ncbi:MAG: molybdenum cofactor guanylyltransferase [Acidobacteria bacterium]|nr:molybdenum cofactor guanylyltransferase [Acidobacteriota bacterium]
MRDDKALLPFAGRPLAAHVAEVVHRTCGNVTLVGSCSKYLDIGIPVIEDVMPGLGPLSGIHAALLHSGDRLSMILGCDMPYVSAEFLMLLRDIAESAQADAVVPESKAFKYEPLCAVYAPACLPLIEAAVQSGDNRIRLVLERVRVRLVTADEWQPYDADGKLFLNLNTPEDYQKAVTGEK